jgi:hypothetical protein
MDLRIIQSLNLNLWFSFASLFFRMGGEAQLKAAVDELVVVMPADERIVFVDVSYALQIQMIALLAPMQRDIGKR